MTDKSLAQTIVKLRHGGEKECVSCPIRNLREYPCQYPQTSENALCAIVDDVIKALEESE